MTPKLLTRNPPLPVVDELSDREMGTYRGIRNWVLCLALLIAGCSLAHAETLKDKVKRQIHGSTATVSEVTVLRFSDRDIRKINQARAELKARV